MKSIGEAVSEGAEAVKDAGARAVQRQWIGFLGEQIALGEDRDEEKRFLIACEIAYKQRANINQEFLVPQRLDLIPGQGFQAQGLDYRVQEEADGKQDIVLDIWQSQKTRYSGFGVGQSQAGAFHDQEGLKDPIEIRRGESHRRDTLWLIPSCSERDIRANQRRGSVPCRDSRGAVRNAIARRTAGGTGASFPLMARQRISLSSKSSMRSYSSKSILIDLSAP